MTKKKHITFAIQLKIPGDSPHKNNVLIDSALELGANVGYNLDAIKKIYPHTIFAN